MGNCLVIQDRKEIKIMSVVDGGGEVLNLKVQEAQLAGGGAVADDDDDPGSAVRVKLVISKQELKKMLDKEGMMSLDDMVSLMREEAKASEREREECCGGGWRPALESIPEGSDDL